MTVKWVVDSFIFEEGRIPEESFKEAGIEFFKFDYIPFLTDKIEIPYSDSEPVVTYTSLNVVNHLTSYYGCYYDRFFYNCNVFMSLLNVPPTEFLNHDHIFCTFKDLLNDYNFYFDLFRRDDLFFRPNGGRKEFTGNVISRESMESELSAIEQMYNMNRDSMILISTPKKIKEEIRFVIGNREILGSSRYRVNDRKLEDDKVKPECTEYVKKIIDGTSWVPDDLFVLDLAMIEEDSKIVPKIIELNSFSCSGWYAGIDTTQMIKKVSEIVERNFKIDTYCS